MGGTIARIFYKKGKDKSLNCQYDNFHDIPVIDIDGNYHERIGDLIVDKKCVMIINVASK